jgi:hypothetical protein
MKNVAIKYWKNLCFALFTIAIFLFINIQLRVLLTYVLALNFLKLECVTDFQLCAFALSPRLGLSSVFQWLFNFKLRPHLIAQFKTLSSLIIIAGVLQLIYFLFPEYSYCSCYFTR